MGQHDEPTTWDEYVASLDTHPAVKEVMRFFAADHLPARLQAISAGCGSLAAHMVGQGLTGPELTVGLRKLLEAKDCFVRAALPKDGYPLVGRDGEQRGPGGFSPGTD